MAMGGPPGPPGMMGGPPGMSPGMGGPPPPGMMGGPPPGMGGPPSGMGGPPPMGNPMGGPSPPGGGDQQELLQQLLRLTPAQIDRLPPDQRQQVLALQSQMGGGR